MLGFGGVDQAKVLYRKTGESLFFEGRKNGEGL